MSFLLDTNVISEVRRAAPGSPLRRWLSLVDGRDTFISVLVLAEVRRGIELLRRRDEVQAGVIEAWLGSLQVTFGKRILAINAEVADAWGRLNVPNQLPIADGLMLATAMVHRLTFVTRNVKDVANAGVPVVNPFEA